MKGRTAWIVAAIAAAAVLALGALLYEGVLQLNHPSPSRYPVRGVDVSNYQGDIDWPALSEQGIDFAFIKATEGSSFQDARFQDNWDRAADTGLRIGAYHFFSYDSPGASQAANFISTVPIRAGMLPPVVDIEFYGDKERHPPERAQVEPMLNELLERLTAHYGVRPILYVTQKSYELYIMGGYEAYDLWVRSVITQPRLPDGRQWTFWQYSNRGRLNGYSGQERFIDLNAFNGSRQSFQVYGRADHE